MYLNSVHNLQLYSQLSLKKVEDRLLINASFPKEFLKENGLEDPFFYVTIYARGGERLKLIDEGTTKIYNLLQFDINPDTYDKIMAFAMQHSKQFQHLSR